MQKANQQKTWLEVSKDNLLFNLEQFRKRVGDRVKIMGVVKSNAYGHGIEQTAEIIQDKVDCFGVDSIDEAFHINTNKKYTLILGYTLIERLDEVVQNGFHQVVANIETLDKLDQITKKLEKESYIHLKIETGTSRQGIFESDLDKFLEYFKNNEKLILAGVSTHFANIEDTTDHSYAEGQLAKYKSAIEKIGKVASTNFIRHTACSAAAVLFPETYFDMVRLGISMYGMWSSRETQVSATQMGIEIELKPALTWKTKIAHLKMLSAGTSVSYGCTEKLSSDSKVAVLPIGYWDGYDRGLSSIGNALVGGKRCRVIGRVCMNMIVIDVDHVKDVKLEDEVVLLGKQGSEEITADEIAFKLDTINYEITTRINQNIKRIVI